MNNQKFIADVSRWVAKTKLAPDVVVRKVLFDISTKLVLKTPVDTGRARANWQFGMDAIPSGEIDGTDAGGGATTSKLLGEAGGAKAGHIHYIVNNLPYMSVLEYGGYPSPPKHPTGKSAGGYSVQAPNGMVRVTFIEVKSSLEKALSKI